jgi:hypothetical protein
MYYNHNVHFESCSAAMAGRYGVAKKSADLLYTNVLPVVSMDPMLEGFLVQPMIVAIRFRRWDDIRKTPEPPATMPAVNAFWRYARGVAAAESGDTKGAEKEKAAFTAAAQRVPDQMLIGPQNTAKSAFRVAGFDLDARIAKSRGDRKAAIESWSKAVAAEDELAYDEPPAWQHPMRECLGAALLADGQAAEAEQVFRADLQKHPRNPRSLFGLAESLKKQGKQADAAWVQAQFEAAWSGADVPLVIGDL